jgi:Na+/melibiose symporter-like transporter
MFASACNVISAIIAFFLLTEKQSISNVSDEGATDDIFKLRNIGVMFAPFKSNKGLRIMTLDYATTFLSFSFLQAFRSVFSIHIIGISNIEVGIINSIVGAVGVVTRIPLGIAVDRFGKHSCMIASSITRPFIIVSYTIANSFNDLILIGMVFRLFSSLGAPARQAMIAEVVEEDVRGLAFSSCSMIGNFMHYTASS